MKKVLFGLLALSAVSMAATITGSETATQGTNVWNTTQTHGEIQIKGTITSDVPVVKYVVFAGDSKESELTLPDFLIKKTNLGFPDGSFVKTPDYIYVKKVDSAGTLQDLDSTEVVTMKTNIELADPNFQSNLNWIEEGVAAKFDAIGALGKAQLEEMVANLKTKHGAGINEMSVETDGINGYHIKTDVGNFLGGSIEIQQITPGAIKFYSGGAVTTSTFHSSAYWPMVMDYLAGGKTMTPNFKLMVKVN